MERYYFLYFIVFVILKSQSNVIPVINLRDNEDKIASDLFSAATEYGFFYLIGHNVSIQVKQSLLNEANKFFNLDNNIKNELKLKIGEHYGYTPFQSETLNQTLSNYGDTKESFYICDENINYDENINWSSKNVWPSTHHLPTFKSILIDYFDTMNKLGYKLNEYLSLSLNLSRNYFNVDEIFGNKPQNVLRLIHYFPIISDIEIGRFGAGQHTDYGIMTFLITDNNQGLQILINDEWLDIDTEIPSIYDQYKNETVIIVNIGDELQRMTNDHYLSTKHRVLMKQAIHRYSAAFFWEPRLTAIIKCVETICDSSKETPKYQPITHGEHLRRKFTKAFETNTNNRKIDKIEL